MWCLHHTVTNFIIIPRKRANSQIKQKSALTMTRWWSDESDLKIINKISDQMYALHAKCISASVIDSQWMSFVHFYSRKICVKIYRDDSWWPGTRSQIIKSLEIYSFNSILILPLTRQSIKPIPRLLMDFWQNQWFMRDFENMYGPIHSISESDWLL